MIKQLSDTVTLEGDPLTGDQLRSMGIDWTAEDVPEVPNHPGYYLTSKLSGRHWYDAAVPIEEAQKHIVQMEMRDAPKVDTNMLLESGKAIHRGLYAVEQGVANVASFAAEMARPIEKAITGDDSNSVAVRDMYDNLYNGLENIKKEIGYGNDLLNTPHIRQNLSGIDNFGVSMAEGMESAPLNAALLPLGVAGPKAALGAYAAVATGQANRDDRMRRDAQGKAPLNPEDWEWKKQMARDLLQGYFGGLMEKIGQDKMFQNITEHGPAVQKILSSIGVETGTEIGETLGDIGTRYWMNGEDISNQDVLNAVVDTVVQSYLPSGSMAVGTTALGKVMEGKHPAADREQLPGTMESLDTAVRNSSTEDLRAALEGKRGVVSDVSAQRIREELKLREDLSARTQARKNTDLTSINPPTEPASASTAAPEASSAASAQAPAPVAPTATAGPAQEGPLEIVKPSSKLESLLKGTDDELYAALDTDLSPEDRKAVAGEVRRRWDEKKAKGNVLITASDEAQIAEEPLPEIPVVEEAPSEQPASAPVAKGNDALVQPEQPAAAPEPQLGELSIKELRDLLSQPIEPELAKPIREEVKKREADQVAGLQAHADAVWAEAQGQQEQDKQREFLGTLNAGQLNYLAAKNKVDINDLSFLKQRDQIVDRLAKAARPTEKTKQTDVSAENPLKMSSEATKSASTTQEQQSVAPATEAAKGNDLLKPAEIASTTQKQPLSGQETTEKAVELSDNEKKPELQADALDTKTGIVTTDHPVYGKQKLSLLEEYKGRYIAATDADHVAVTSKDGTTVFFPALDESQKPRQWVAASDTVATAKKYIDWITKTQVKSEAPAAQPGVGAASEQQAGAASGQATSKPVSKLKGKLLKAAAKAEAARAEYFKPGNIVPSWGNAHDRVISYQPAAEGKPWSVTVRAVEQKEGKWVDAEDRDRIHATQPTKKEMESGPVGRVESVSEPTTVQKKLEDARAKATKPAVAEQDHPQPEPSQDPVEQAAPVAPTTEPTQPATTTYGSTNKLVSKDRAEEVRKRIQAKFRELRSGIDPEMLSLGTELAAFHIEAGARRFVDMAAAVSKDLGIELSRLRPYLEGWYMGARGMMKGHGMDVVGMDNEEGVENAIKNLLQNKMEGDNNQKGETNANLDERRTGEPSAVPAEAAPRNDQELHGGAQAGPRQGTDGEGRVGEPVGGVGRPGVERGEQRGTRSLEGERDQEKGIRGIGTGNGDGRPDGEGSGSRPNPGVAENYRIRPEDTLHSGTKTRGKSQARANLDAIRLAKQITAEGRLATDDEKRTLLKYTGWGATELRNGMFPDASGKVKPEWQDLAKELKDALTEEEYRTAARSTQYAHYTSKGIVSGIHDALLRLGFDGGKMFEPGLGLGHFIGLLPESIAGKVKYHGVEMDNITGMIARILYPQAHISIEDFANTKVPKEYFDAAAGNPPFSETVILGDPEYAKMKLPLHDFFFMKTIDRVRPGGLLAFVSSRYTMDKGNAKMREAIAEKSDFLGAIRLPQTAFKENAGTEVVTDVIFLRKKDGRKIDSPSWTGTKEIDINGEKKTINEYFVDHPEMVLGTHSTEGTMYSKNEYTVKPLAGDIEQHFANAAKNLPENIYAKRGEQADKQVQEAKARDFDASHVKENSVYEKGGKLYQVKSGAGEELTTTKTAAEKIRGLLPIKEALLKVVRAQVAGENSEAHQKELNAAYDAFVKKHGPINKANTSTWTTKAGKEIIVVRKPNLDPLKKLGDPDVHRLASIEHYNEDTGVAKKGPFFSEVVIGRDLVPDIKSAKDALLYSMSKDGGIDLAEVARLNHGQSVEDATKELTESGVLFVDPVSGQHVMDDAYLSGNVREKLAQAKAAAEKDASFQRNVDALEKVQPKPIPPSKIRVKFGASFVPGDIMEQFATEVVGLRQGVKIAHLPTAGTWGVDNASDAPSTTYATKDISATQIFEHVINFRPIKIMRRVDEDHVEVDPEATALANNKASQMKVAFESWLRKNTEASARITDVYNTLFNSNVVRSYNGEHLTLPGVSTKINLRPHQKRVIWRILQTGNTYMAHSVGSGKTMAMISAGMEMKRLGQVSKPLYVVPNHMLDQFAKEFMELYPTANIKVCSKEQFVGDKRKQFVADVAANNYDAVIIKQSSFGLIAPNAEHETRMAREEITAIEQAIANTEKKSQTRRRLERKKEQLENKLQELANRKKDSGITFDELGVDFLFVDEAHGYRKLRFATQQQNIKGVDPDGSNRAWDLYVKSRYLDEKNPGRSLVLASGTPITNTIGELYSVQRFMGRQALADTNLSSFDSWSANFGDTINVLERTPSGGYQAVSRFASFFNLPELMTMARNFMDIVTSDDLSKYVKRPAIKGGGIQMRLAEESDMQKAYKQDLAARMDAIATRKGPPAKGQDIILNVITDGRHAAIDDRFVDPSAAPNPHNKLGMLISDAVDIYNQHKDNVYHDETGAEEPYKGGTMMIFADLGVHDRRGFSAYRWMKEEMVRQGIPEHEIAFMQDYDTDPKKLALFKDMNSGKKKILIGSTASMGTGVNAQQRLVAELHLDAPWYPADMEQRIGRIFRQGNKNKEITVYGYATKASYDETMYQKLVFKQNFINQLFRGDTSIREMEDMDEMSNPYAVAHALTSGDPRIMEKAKLEGEVMALEQLERGFYDDKVSMQSKIRSEIFSIEWDGKKKVEAIQVGERITKTRGDAFAMKIGGQDLTERKAAGEKLGQAILKAYIKAKKEAGSSPRMDDATDVGEVGGLRFDVGFNVLGSNGYADVKFQDSPFQVSLDLGKIERGEFSPMGIIQSIENELIRIKGLPAMLDDRIKESQEKIDSLKEQLNGTFDKEAELNDKRNRLEEITRDLTAVVDKIAEQQQQQAANTENMPETKAPGQEENADDADGEMQLSNPVSSRSIEDFLGADNAAKMTMEEILDGIYQYKDQFLGAKEMVVKVISRLEAQMMANKRAQERGTEAPNLLQSWGFAYKGGVYLIKENLNISMLSRLLAHEHLGHIVARQILGEEEYQRIMGLIAKERGPELLKLAKDANYATNPDYQNPDGSVNLRKMAQEWFANNASDFLHQPMKPLSALQKFVVAVKLWLKRHTGIDLGVDEVHEALRKAVDAYRGGPGGGKMTKQNEALDLSNPSTVQDDDMLLANGQSFRSLAAIPGQAVQNYQDSSYSKMDPQTLWDHWDSLFPSKETKDNGDMGTYDGAMGRTAWWLGKKYPEIYQAVQVALKRGRDNIDTTVRLLRYMQPYTMLSVADRELVNKVLIEGDRKGEEYSVAELQAKGLTMEQIDGYVGMRNALDGVQDDMVAQLQQEINKIKDYAYHELEYERVEAQTALGKALASGNESDISRFKADVAGLTSRIERLGAEAAKHEQALQELRSVKGYFPRVRDNGIHLIYRKKVDHPFDRGARVRRVFPNNAFGSKELAAFKELLKRDGYTEVSDSVAYYQDKTDMSFYTEVVEPKPEELFQEDLKELENSALLGVALTGLPESNQQIAKEMLKTILFTRGWRRHLMNRHSSRDGDVVEGYEDEDLGDAALTYIRGYAGIKSKAAAARSWRGIMANMEPSKKQNVYSFLDKMVREELRNKGKADQIARKMASFGFLWYLGFRFSSAAVNATQNFLVGQPTLSQMIREKNGSKTVGVAAMQASMTLTNAMKDAALFMRDSKTGGFLTAGERAFLQAEEQYLIHQEFTSDQAKQLSEKTGWFDHVMTGAAFMFTKVEQMNRYSAALAYYRTFHDLYPDTPEGQEELRRDAEGFVLDTHFSYDSWNQPTLFMSNDAARAAKPLIFGLQSYNSNFWQSVMNMDKRAKFGLLVAYFLAAGVPFDDFLKWLYRQGFDRDAVKDIENAMGSYFKDSLEVGPVAAAMRVDLTGSLAPSLPPIPNLVLSLSGVKEAVTGSENAGPMQSIASGFADGIRSGKWDAMLPKAVQSVYQAVAESELGQGIKPVRGKDNFHLSPIKAFVRVTGLNPLDRANWKAEVRNAKAFRAEISEARKELGKRYNAGKATAADVQDWNQELASLYKAYGDQFITLDAKGRPTLLIDSSYLKQLRKE